MSGRFDRSISSQHAPRGVGLALRVGGLAWFVSWVCALAACVLGLAWLVGAVCSDRWLWSQYLSWIPTQGVVVGVFAGWAGSVVMAVAARWLIGTGPVALTRRMGRRLPARMVRRVVLALGAISLAGLCWEWRVDRYVVGPQVPGEGSLRVLFLNAASVDTSPALDAIRDASPDIVLLSNPRYASKRSMIIGGVREAVGLGAEETRGDMLVSGRVFFASRATIQRSGVVSLGLSQMTTVTEQDERGREVTRSVASDAGRAMFLTLGLPEGETITLWVIDIPRDLDRSRAEMMRGAREAIDAWRDPRDPSRYRVDALGRTIAVIGEPPRDNSDGGAADRAGDGAVDRAGADGDVASRIGPGPEDIPAGFPPADLVIGDLNTPRGSWSLGLLVGEGMTGAFAQAGRGPAATWPRENAVKAIDLAFTSPRWRVVGHRAVDLGAGTHRAIVVDLVRARQRPSSR